MGVASALAAAGETPCRLHNNCSGKHAGFLTVSRHMGEPVENYGEIGHPVQQRVMATLSALTGIDISQLPVGIDGCGVPTFAMHSIRELAGAQDVAYLQQALTAFFNCAHLPA